MTLLQEITLRYAKVQLFDSKLIRIEVFGNRIIGKDEARELSSAIAVLSKDQDSLVMIVANEVTQFTKDAIEFSISEDGLRFVIGDALVVKSLTQRITANIYLKLNKPKKPSKIFNTEKEATKWLLSLEEELVPVW